MTPTLPPPEAALDQLLALEDPAKAAEMAAYHKSARRFLGVPVPQVETLCDGWRDGRSLDDRVALARSLWDSDIHEARIAAAKLLTQARLRPDDAVWQTFLDWVPQFDGWALADHACKVGERRLLADPARIDTVAAWTTDPNPWVRRAALVVTLPWAKLNHLKPQDAAIRARVLDWAAAYVDDRDWFIQKAVAWWLRDLSKHDAAATRAFLDGPGRGLKPFARKEAAKHLRP